MKPHAASLRLLAFLVSGLATAMPLHAQLVAYDGFDSYAAGAQVESGGNGSSGTGLYGGAGWGGAYDVNNAIKSLVLVEDRSASHVVYQNGEIRLDGGVRALRLYNVANGSSVVARPLGAAFTTASAVYLSFLFRTTNASPLADQDFFQWGFDATLGAGNPRVSIGANTIATTFPPSQPFRFFARSTTTTGNSAFDNTTDIAAVTTYFLVGKISGGAGNFNRVDLFVNPSTLAEPAAPSASIAVDSGVASLSHLLLRTAFLDASDAYVFDELRVGRSFTSVVSGDGDGDGMPEAWELAHGFDPLNAADAAPDADGDGQTNLAEYRAGTDPRDPLSRFAVTEIVASADTVSLTWMSAPGRRYHLQWSDALASWTTLTDAGAPLVIDAAGSSTTFLLNNQLAAERRYFRIEVLPE